jgi:guanylate kinase
LTPSSLEVLETRLKRRGANTPEDLRRRLEVAKEEIAQQGKFQHHIVSASVEEDVRAMEEILDEERERRCQSRG